MFDIEAHHRRENVIHALTGPIGIGAAGAVARGDVQIAVRTDLGLAPVMAAGRPFDDDRLRFGPEMRRIAPGLQLKSRDTAELRTLDLRV